MAGGGGQQLAVTHSDLEGSLAPTTRALYERNIRRLVLPAAAAIAARWQGIDLRPLGPVADQLRLGPDDPRGAPVTGGELAAELVDHGVGIEADGAGHRVVTDQGDVGARFLVTCGGLHSDRLARLEGGDPGAAIVPFRGEYYRLVPERTSLVRGLIYPVPDPQFPFLGVHLTRMVDGTVHAGPNAVLALAREGYGRFAFSPADALAPVAWPGFWPLACRYWRTGATGLRRALSPQASTASLRELVDDTRCVAIGLRATLRDGGGEAMSYEIVFPGDGEVDKGWVSADSPLGLALLGASAGDLVHVDAPAGQWSVTVVSVD